MDASNSSSSGSKWPYYPDTHARKAHIIYGYIHERNCTRIEYQRYKQSCSLCVKMSCFVNLPIIFHTGAITMSHCTRALESASANRSEEDSGTVPSSDPCRTIVYGNAIGWTIPPSSPPLVLVVSVM